MEATRMNRKMSQELIQDKVIFRSKDVARGLVSEFVLMVVPIGLGGKLEVRHERKRETQDDHKIFNPSN